MGMTDTEREKIKVSAIYVHHRLYMCIIVCIRYIESLLREIGGTVNNKDTLRT